MNLSKYPDPESIRLARKGGCKAKCPKKPKAGASNLAMENWGGRYNNWVKKVNAAKTASKTNETLRDQIRKVR